MANIRIKPDQVRAVASTFRQKSQESQQMIANLEAQVNGMQPDFEGMTSQKFYSDYQDWRSKMQQFTQLLDGIAQQLDAIATKFEQTDGAG